MREDCKFFQRRIYRAGDVASFCALGLAPEAPWRCPADCKRFQRVIGDAGRSADDQGGRSPRTTDPELAAGAAGVLESAQEIIGALAPELAAEERRRQRARQEADESWWNKVRRSPRWRR